MSALPDVENHAASPAAPPAISAGARNPAAQTAAQAPMPMPVNVLSFIDVSLSALRFIATAHVIHAQAA
jgi:hypothetical protein